MIYDYLIIGKGLIGCAAARYLSRSGKKVALTGPDETSALKTKVVFGSHYDQSRIQRILGEDPTWSLLNLQSARQYPYLEKESGISFHSGEGCLYVNPYGEDSYLRKAKEQGKEFLTPHRFYDSDEALRLAFSAYHFPAGSKGMLEISPSGHINPRRLIEAQLTLAGKNGTDIFNDIVTDLVNDHGIQKINTLNGPAYYAQKVLLTPGAFVNFFNLIKNKLQLRLKSESTIWARVDPGKAAHYSRLPSLLYRINEEDLQDIYLVKPLSYPNGDYIVKMGGNLPYDIFFDSLTEVQQWFMSESPLSFLKPLQEGLKKIMPQLPVIDAALKNCIISYTAHGKPYIGQIDNNLFVATGGNGYAAMCSDALGNIAATLLLENKFPDGYSAEEFQPLFSGEILPFQIPKYEEMQEKKIKITAISGSTRKTSTNHRLIRALQNGFGEVFDIVYFDNISRLPHFNPDEDDEKAPPEVSCFRGLLNDSEGIIICTPEYAHGVPGSLKNAIDWTVGSGEFSGKPTLLITASTDGQSAHRSLLETLKVIEAKNVDTLQLLIPFAATKIDTDNRVTDEKTGEELTRLMRLLEETIRKD